MMYIAFAYVVVKQVKLMNETLEVGYEKLMRSISYIHLGFSFFVLFLAVIVL